MGKALIFKLLQGDEDIVKGAQLQVSSYEGGRRLEEDGEGSPSTTMRLHLSLAARNETLHIIPSSAGHATDFLLAHSSLKTIFRKR